MLTGKALGDAIERAIKLKGVHKKDVAAEFNIKPPSITDWVKHGRIDKKHLPHLVAYFSDVVGPEHWGLPREWGGRPEGEIVGDVSEWGSDTPLDADRVALTYLPDTELGIGPGRYGVAEDRGHRLWFARSFLGRKGVDPSCAVAAKVSGNSMEPVLPDGATIAINKADKRIVDGKMYAVDHDGLFRVKMLYRLPGGGLRLRSYNRDEHPDEDLDAYASQALTVIGRVFWYAAEPD